jgi:GNAT superfamily N-acetyltransferase
MSLTEYKQKPEIIRRIKPKDAEDIKKYLFRISSINDITKGIKEDLKEIKKGNSERFVLEIDGKVVGNISIKRNKNPIRKHIAEFFDFVISEKYQGKGYSSLLFKKSLEWAKRNKINLILISGRKGTKAQKIYEHLGFKKYGELKEGIKAPWENKIYDEIFYYIKLK